MLKWLFCILILFPSIANAWDKTDKILFSSFIAFETIDCIQTREILDNPKFFEHNNIINSLGKKGIIPYFMVCSIGTYLIADNLKPSHRKIFLSMMNMIEINSVHHNYVIGVKLKF